jgi:NAD(P)-dependent dehydrogenase (short-subunit alcohol dehydrogenase family)
MGGAYRSRLWSSRIGLAREVAKDGIRVNAVAPGLVETDIHAATGDPERPQRLAPAIPLGRGARTEEIADAVFWLLWPSTADIPGAILALSNARQEIAMHLFE